MTEKKPKLLREATRMVEAGIVDGLSPEGIAGNILCMVECEAVLARKPKEVVEQAVARAITEAFNGECRVFDYGQAETLASAAIETYEKAMRGGG